MFKVLNILVNEKVLLGKRSSRLLKHFVTKEGVQKAVLLAGINGCKNMAVVEKELLRFCNVEGLFLYVVDADSKLLNPAIFLYSPFYKSLAPGYQFTSPSC